MNCSMKTQRWVVTTAVHCEKIPREEMCHIR
jgi:hypothetical protein